MIRKEYKLFTINNVQILSECKLFRRLFSESVRFSERNVCDCDRRLYCNKNESSHSFTINCWYENSLNCTNFCVSTSASTSTDKNDFV